MLWSVARARIAAFTVAVGIAAAQAPADAPSPADRAAWVMVLNLIKDAPPPAWSRHMREQFLAKFGFTTDEAALMIVEANIYALQTEQASKESIKLFAAIQRGKSSEKAEAVAARVEAEQRRRIETAIRQVRSHLGPSPGTRVAELLAHVRDRSVPPRAPSAR